MPSSVVPPRSVPSASSRLYRSATARSASRSSFGVSFRISWNWVRTSDWWQFHVGTAQHGINHKGQLPPAKQQQRHHQQPQTIPSFSNTPAPFASHVVLGKAPGDGSPGALSVCFEIRSFGIQNLLSALFPSGGNCQHNANSCQADQHRTADRKHPGAVVTSLGQVKTLGVHHSQGTMALKEPLSSVMVTASPLTVATAVTPSLPQTGQIFPSPFVVITTFTESFRRVYPASVATSVMV